MKKYDVIAVGSAVVDFFVGTNIKDAKGNLCLPAGSKLLVKDFEMATGGGGTNTAVGFSRLGLKTGFVGKVGDDFHGKIILNELKSERVDFLGSIGKERTGVSVILDSAQRKRTVLTFKGANDFISFNDLSKNFHARWFYLSSLIGESLHNEIKIAKLAKGRGAKIAYNVSSYLAQRGVGAVREILRCVDVLILNDEEARDLIPNGNFFEGLRAFGPKIVCVTYGEKGSECYNGARYYRAIPRRVNVIEATGAGDAFAAGFVTGMILNEDIADCMKFGSVNASSVILKKGAKNGLLRLHEVRKLAVNFPVKVRNIESAV